MRQPTASLPTSQRHLANEPVVARPPIIAFSPDGKHFALHCLNWNGAIQIREATSDRLLGTLEGHREQLFSLDFSPDGNRLLSGGRDQMVKLWDWRSRRELLSLKAPSVISSARFAPDGRKIVAGGWFDHALLWEAATPEQVTAWETEDAAGAKQWAAQTEELRKRQIAEATAQQESLNAQRAEMEQATAKKLALLGDPARFAEDPGAIRHWLVLPAPGGAFWGAPMLDGEQLPDEARLRPRPLDHTRVGEKDLVWVPVHLEDHRLDLKKDVQSGDACVAYAVSYVFSERDQSGLILKVGSDYHAKLYFNGRPIHRSLKPATVEPDRDTVTGVELKAGLNVLVFKVVRWFIYNQPPWGGSVRFTTADGSPVQGITVTLDPDAKP